MAQPAYTTLVKLKSYLGITSADHDTELTDVIEQVSSLFDAIHGQTFQQLPFIEWHDGSHSEGGLITDEIPTEDAADLLATFKCFEDEVALTIDVDFRVDPYPSRRVRRLESALILARGFAVGTRNIRFEYNARFKVIPPDIERATLDESLRAWQMSNASGASDGARVGLSQRSPETGTSLTYTVDDLTPTTLRMLENYRRQRAF